MRAGKHGTEELILGQRSPRGGRTRDSTKVVNLQSSLDLLCKVARLCRSDHTANRVLELAGRKKIDYICYRCIRYGKCANWSRWKKKCLRFRPKESGR